MTLAVRSAVLILALSATPGLIWAQAQQRQAEPEPAGKEGLDYFILQSSIISLSSIGPNYEQTEIYAAGIALGTYISDYFKVELRAGGGLTDDTARYRTVLNRGEEPSWVSLDVSLPYYASWYLGILYPWSDFSHVYGQFGFSHVKGEADTDNPDRFDISSDKLYGSSFSMSWLLGVDVELTESTYILLEGGRLHTDTETNINTMQYNLGLRYEF